MNIPTKIKLAETYAKMSEAELARKLVTTSQALGRRLEAAEEGNGHKRRFYRFDNKIRLPHRQRESDLHPAGVLQGY